MEYWKRYTHFSRDHLISPSEMASLVEALLTNGAAITSRHFVPLVGMFSDVMLLEVVSSVKASAAHSTRKAARLTMNGLSMRFLTSKRLGAKVTHRRLSVRLSAKVTHRRRSVLLGRGTSTTDW